jgi:hypothetical protein
MKAAFTVGRAAETTPKLSGRETDLIRAGAGDGRLLATTQGGSQYFCCARPKKPFAFSVSIVTFKAQKAKHQPHTY